MLESDLNNKEERGDVTDGSFLPVVSLFSGSGGLDEGFIQAGFSPVLAIDIDRAACETFSRNHTPARVLRKDLSQAVNGYVVERLLEFPSDIQPIGVIGGPPCQAFSLSNVHKRSDDPRLKLPENYAHVLAELNRHYGLDFFVFENVLGLKHAVHSVLFNYFKELFASAGFTIFEGELDAQDFDVAQVRKRVFIVGFNTRKYRALRFEFPRGDSSQRKTVREVIGSLPPPVFFDRGMSSNDVPFHPNHWCLKPKSKKFFNGFLKEGDMKGRPFRVLDWNKPSWTVAYGHREVHIHPSGKRRLSVYEAMLLQGFRPDYVFVGNLSEQIRLVSDAVPPPMARALAESVLTVLNASRDKTRQKQATLFAKCP
ncbi:MAG TPA: DNA cytosine methyltransferase [Candidatus Binatia bacterium]|jgi:DNA (cytosine-5)-methyltransferase 1|nr:DNA cytosine methyltransferase [Candidatus Binatia bacterium]